MLCIFFLSVFTKNDYPTNFKNSKDLGNEVIMKGGSVLFLPLGKILADAGNDKRTIIYSDINLDEIIEGKYDFDVVGHYSRPDL